MTSAGGFPGDELIADPLLVIDRHASFVLPPEELWPWIVQIGKGRGGWYMPGWVERVIPRARRGSWSVRPDLQDVSVGSVGGDWGPGEPEFHAVAVEPPSRLVWLSLRDPEAGHRWPASEAPPWPDRVLAFSWALLLSPDAAGGTHLHVRLRMTKGAWRSDPTFRIKRVAFDFFDWLTIVALFAGLRERLRQPPPPDLAEQLRPVIGQWVAIRDDQLLHAAGTPQELVGWLNRHGQTADSMFRVPEDDRAATGLAPW